MMDLNWTMMDLHMDGEAPYFPTNKSCMWLLAEAGKRSDVNKSNWLRVRSHKENELLAGMRFLKLGSSHVIATCYLVCATSWENILMLCCISVEGATWAIRIIGIEPLSCAHPPAHPHAGYSTLLLCCYF